MIRMRCFICKIEKELVTYDETYRYNSSPNMFRISGIIFSLSQDETGTNFTKSITIDDADICNDCLFRLLRADESERKRCNATTQQLEENDKREEEEEIL